MSSISDKEFYHLTVSINKALNPMEAPLKIKHARSAIITTHRTKEAKTFWMVVTRQPLMEHRFTAWKFLHLLHKILREGHENTIRHSQTHKKMIIEMGKLWGHLQDGVGNCIHAYSKLIVTKLEFHEKNTLFPGSLVIDFYEVEKFAGDDINVYFQLCVELFDYLDNIIDMQSTIFTSINTYRMSSMTPQGQCRLAPLITLIQDSNPLYDLSVRVMFKLHDKLSSDMLSGHRDRFRDLFAKLKFFYDNVRPLQYFADLIQVPHLPDSAPNFTSKVDYGSYIPPVMFVQPDPEPLVDNLVDTTNAQVQQEPVVDPREIMLLENTVRDKEVTIRELEQELTSTKDVFVSMESRFKHQLHQMREEMDVLTNDLAVAKEVAIHLRTLKDDLELRLENTPTLMQKVNEEEGKAKASEEKFNKLKTMYTQIRDEHINLLRQHGESTKLLNKEKQINMDLTTEVQELSARIRTIERDTERDSSKAIELQAKVDDFTIQLDTITRAHTTLKDRYKKQQECRGVESEQLSIKEEELRQNNMKLRERDSEIESLKASLNETQNELRKKSSVHDEIMVAYKNEMERKIRTISDLEQAALEIEERNNQIRGIEQSLLSVEDKLKVKETVLCQIEAEKISVKNDLREAFKKQIDLEGKLNAVLEEKQTIVAAQQASENKCNTMMSTLLRVVLNSMNCLSATTFNDPNDCFEKSIKLLDKTNSILSELNAEYRTYCKDKNSIEGLARISIILGYYLAMLHEQCIMIVNATTNIQKGQELLDQVNQLSDPLIKLYNRLDQSGETSDILLCIEEIRTNLTNINQLIRELLKSLNGTLELDDLVERELEDMNKAIEEATERFVDLLSNARSEENSLKLEVNEKILDACTNLMSCIKLLIKKSRILQEEIISTGRGTTSVKEFYKRNSQWTEGLISASKSVAKGANFLVDAANKAVTSESSQNFEIIVAAQEIAACTAQLVIASKVKAPKESQKLTDLTKASRNVTQATGVVVATVKDCNKHFEQMQDFDLSKLTTSQAKTMEMDIHVRVLELEQSLQLERLKLSTFRKNYYQHSEN